jgi:uncharacterized protein YkwD
MWRLSAIRLPRAGQLTRRLAVGLGFTVLLTGLVLTVPVVSSGAGDRTGHGSPPVTLDAATTSSTAQSEPRAVEPASGVVVLGVDGAGSPSSAGTPGSSDPVAASSSEARSVESASAPAPAATAAGTTTAGSSSAASPAAPAGTAQQPPAATTSSSSSSAASSSAASSVPRRTPSSGPVNAETQLGALVALARSQAGCASSDVDTSLADLAKKHSKQMRDAGALAPLDAAHGVVAKGSTDLDAVVQAWLADSGDRAALLDCSATALGVGVVNGTANGSGGPWYTLALA